MKQLFKTIKDIHTQGVIGTFTGVCLFLILIQLSGFYVFNPFFITYIIVIYTGGVTSSIITLPRLKNVI